MMKRESEEKLKGNAQSVVEQSSEFKCKICDFTTRLRSEWLRHLWSSHGLTEWVYEEHTPGTPLPRVLDCGEIKRTAPPPPPPACEPEPKVKIRLAPIESNPRNVSVEARPMCVYHFERGEWVEIPVPDARLLLPSDLSPGLYGHLQFEGKPKKRRKK